MATVRRDHRQNRTGELLWYENNGAPGDGKL
jgi:hypothetical protein